MSDVRDRPPQLDPVRAGCNDFVHQDFSDWLDLGFLSGVVRRLWREGDLAGSLSFLFPNGVLAASFSPLVLSEYA